METMVDSFRRIQTSALSTLQTKHTKRSHLQETKRIKKHRLTIVQRHVESFWSLKNGSTRHSHNCPEAAGGHQQQGNPQISCKMAALNDKLQAKVFKPSDPFFEVRHEIRHVIISTCTCAHCRLSRGCHYATGRRPVLFTVRARD